MAYLITGTKVNRPLLTKSNRDDRYLDCKSTRPKTITRRAPDRASAERLLLDLVERDVITFGTWEKI